MFSSNANNGPVYKAADITAADGSAASYVSMVCAGCGAVLVCLSANPAYVGVTVVAEVYNGVRWTIVPLVSVSGQDAPLSRVLVDSSTNAYYVPCIGASSMRVRATARTSGTVAVDMSGTPTPMCMMPDATLRAGERLTENYMATRLASYTGTTDALSKAQGWGVAGLQIKASPGNLHLLFGACVGTGYYIQVHDKASIPLAGESPKISMWCPANTPYFFNFYQCPENFTLGIYVVAGMTTESTYTVAVPAAAISFHGRYY